MIDDIASYAKPILVLSGGEPLFRPDIFDLARYAESKGLRVALSTNGTLINEAMACSIKDARIARVSVSLDGATAPTHDRFRGQGNFERAIKGLVHLGLAGISRQVNMTVTRYNVHELSQMYELCLELGVDGFYIFMLVPVGCGGCRARAYYQWDDYLEQEPYCIYEPPNR